MQRSKSACILIFMLSASLPSAPAQASIRWSTGETSLSRGIRVRTDVAGDAWFVEVVNPQITGAAHTRLERLDPQGGIAWARDYSTVDNDDPADLAIDAAGNAFVAGNSENGPSSQPAHPFVLKFDAAGVAAWAQTYVTTNRVSVAAARLDSAGDFIIAGEQIGTPTGLFVQKWTSGGTLAWTRVFTPFAMLIEEFFSDMTVDSAGNTYVCGAHGIPQLQALPTYDGMITAKIDPLGNLAWVGVFNPIPRGRAASVACDSIGRVIVTGQFDGAPATQLPLLAVLSYDAAGNLVWADTATNGMGQRVVVDSDDHIVVAFTKYAPVPSQSELYLRKYDALGAILWESDVGPGGWIADMSVDADRAITVVRSDLSSSTVVARVNRDGRMLWSIGTPVVSSIAVCADQTLRLAGWDYASTTSVIERVDPWIRSFCFGDGSGTACPCGNLAAPGEREGCLNSLAQGGKLLGSGIASLTNDTLVLTGSQMTNAGVLYFQGTAQASASFGDGIRCVGGNVHRLGQKINASGASQYPEIGEAPVSVRGQVATAGTLTYQAWYRNAAIFCTSAAFNLTNGLLVDWHP